MLKTIFSRTKLILTLIYGLIMIAIVLYIGFIISLILQDNTALESSRFVNMASLIVAFISLPGILQQLLTVNMGKKKKHYLASTKCPNCRHLIELNMKEK
jgi:hypothetical protein